MKRLLVLLVLLATSLVAQNSYEVRIVNNRVKYILPESPFARNIKIYVIGTDIVTGKEFFSLVDSLIVQGKDSCFFKKRGEITSLFPLKISDAQETKYFRIGNTISKGKTIKKPAQNIVNISNILIKYLLISIGIVALTLLLLLSFVMERKYYITMPIFLIVILLLISLILTMIISNNIIFVIISIIITSFLAGAIIVERLSNMIIYLIFLMILISSEIIVFVKDGILQYGVSIDVYIILTLGVLFIVSSLFFLFFLKIRHLFDW